MTESRYDAAKRCPSCGEPGEMTRKENRSDGSTIYTWTCRNGRCEDEKRGWIMQVMGNSEIPLRERAQE